MLFRSVSQSRYDAFTYDSSTITYFAAGASGTLTTSTDSISWTLRTSGFGAAVINTLAYASDKSEKYIAAGGSGGVASSTDSIAWRLRTTGFGNNAISSSYYINGLYIVTAAAGNVATSTDAITWRLRTSGFGTSEINAITYANDTFIIGGANGTMAYASLTDILNGTGVFSVSTDTVSWQVRTVGNGLHLFNNVNSINSSGTLYMIGGRNSNLTPLLLHSTDTISWVLRTSIITSS